MIDIRKRIKKNGKPSYNVCIRLKGHQTVSKTFERLTDAREWAAKTTRDIKNNLNFPERKAKKYTIAEIIDRFIENKVPEYKPTMQREFIKALNWYKSEIGKLYLSGVTRAILVECKEKLLQKHKEIPTKNGKILISDKLIAPATVNHYMSCMFTVFSYCVKDLDIIDINPMSKVEKVKTNNARKRFLESKEIDKLLHNCLNINYELYLCVLIALTTGARKSEILKLTWGDIDLEQKMVYFFNTKNGTDRGTPIHEFLLQELINYKNQNKIRHLKNDYVFKTADGKPNERLISKIFPKIVKQSGIQDFRFHDLRHTAASWQAMSGTSQPILQEILGHKTPAMTSRYKHLMAEYKRPAIEKAGDIMLSDFIKQSAK